MKVLRNIALLFLIFIVAIAGCIFYAFQIEPYRLKVHPYNINQQQEGTTGYKMVQISDLHIKQDFTDQNLKKVVDKINEQIPDIVLFTGDLYDNYAQYNDDENIVAELQRIQANYAKIAIWGNRDYGGGAENEYQYLMESAGFQLLKNQDYSVTLNNGKTILFTGLDDSLLGNPSLPSTKESHHFDYHILLTHEPDTAENYLSSNYDFAFSGHSHGGQINIPFFPALKEFALSNTSLSSKYSGGMYSIGNTSNFNLYVNTGIGTTHISARFGVVPEIAVFQLFL